MRIGSMQHLNEIWRARRNITKVLATWLRFQAGPAAFPLSINLSLRPTLYAQMTCTQTPVSLASLSRFAETF